MKYELTAAIIGSGYMGKKYLDILSRIVKKVVLCTNDVIVGEKLAEEYNIKFYTDYHNMFENEKLDFVSVCLPTHLHYDATMEAFNYGVNVMCEKPFASTAEQAREMVETAEEKKLLLMVGHCVRFIKSYEYLRKCIADNRFGKLLYLDLYRHGMKPEWSAENWLMNASLSGGVTHDLHIHDTDIILNVLGMPDSVQTTGSVTACSTIYRYDDLGLAVTASASWRNATALPGYVGYDAIFENASLKMVNDTISLYTPDGQVENPIDSETFSEYFAGKGGDYRLAEITYFCDCLVNKISPQICLPRDSYATMLINCAEMESMQSGEVKQVQKPKLPPLRVEVEKVKPLIFGKEYESRMILDHVITGRDDVIQINHGTVKAGYALGGAAHEEDEIYYILSGHGKLRLDDEVVDIVPNQVVFIPAGCFHALDNSESAEDMCILTFWRDWRFNDAYEERIKQWGKSFKTIDED